MKKVVGGLLAASALLSLAACGGSSDNASSSDFSIKDRYELDEKTPAWKLGTNQDHMVHQFRLDSFAIW